MDYLTHGDLRSPSREYTRERSLRKKSHKHSSSATSIPATFLHPGSQPLTLDETEQNAKNKSKKDKKKREKEQETVTKVKKREDRRKSEVGDVAVMEEEMSRLGVAGKPENKQRRTSTSKPKHLRKGSNSHLVNMGGVVSSTTTTEPTRPAMTSPKQSNQHTQFSVSEGLHERSGDVDEQMKLKIQEQ